MVTQGRVREGDGRNPSEFSATGKSKDKVAGQDTKRFPVENVSWDDAVEFCRKLSEMPEERAAGRHVSTAIGGAVGVCVPRGSTGRYGFSLGRNAVPKEYDENGLSDYGWFGGNSGWHDARSGREAAHAWGLYDMHGNVWEWCQDWYDKEYYANIAYG